MQHGAMNAGFLQAVFTMQFPVFVRKPARYQIRLEKPALLDLTSHKQDVVQIAIEPENSPVEIFPNTENSPMYFDNSHTIEIETKGLLIRMSNNLQPVLLKALMDALKEPLC